jgi:adenylosuccinate lyase
MNDAIEGLTVDPERMRANIDATRGVIFAERAMMLLAPEVGRERAQRAIAAAVEGSAQHLNGFAGTLAQEIGHTLVPDGLTRPEDYLGAAEHFRLLLLRNDAGKGDDSENAECTMHNADGTKMKNSQ